VGGHSGGRTTSGCGQRKSFHSATNAMYADRLFAEPLSCGTSFPSSCPAPIQSSSGGEHSMALLAATLVRDPTPLRMEPPSPPLQNGNLRWRSSPFSLTVLSSRSRGRAGIRCWRLPSIGGWNVLSPNDGANGELGGDCIGHHPLSLRRLRPSNPRSSPPNAGWNPPPRYTFVCFFIYSIYFPCKPLSFVIAFIPQHMHVHRKFRNNPSSFSITLSGA
jgi:hypothetical protein